MRLLVQHASLYTYANSVPAHRPIRWCPAGMDVDLRPRGSNICYLLSAQQERIPAGESPAVSWS